MAKADDQMYRRVFGQGDGEIILEDLVRRYAARAKTDGGIDAILKTYHGAGAREVVELILSKVNAGRQEIADSAEPNE
ncbi:hypothetical protein [Xanthomonas rydalmerensis]|uniref:Bbp19-like phage domain-containing protein n=1 Tax=Xanthomonas rydalmerensis TaxID=3046274 RepID=A0ABZ0JNG0_9XANT|nr:hypothetical protein [Xanthomonas sp. DM-2023]WOS40687.1 hypothetical protein QN243_20215 [Xanthomonas sp. DM-2023]WOS44871.1 hypothetical protein QN242_20215 [Xanthomonas sp. DM-2023]WOS49051.1 hypothetical protein QN240_20215 [Xanthomonas sp. DM-2023]WOS53231.1 hypothetical protein QN244_20220 [Xanthomonas sp. DM-2023]WOS57414.1 hypothetical protein QN245_20215 [Xanthomonas sp. DM-2023]